MVQRPALDSLQLPKARWKRIYLRVFNIIQPRQIMGVLSALRTIPGVCLAVTIAAPWYVAVGMATDGQFLVEFLWRHNVGRAVSSMEGHDGGVLFYPLALLVGTFPWSLWLIPIDPLSSREHILLSNIFNDAWTKGQSLELGSLIDAAPEMRSRNRSIGRSEGTSMGPLSSSY